jgi:hypothetical protein
MKKSTLILSLDVLCTLGLAALTASRAAVEPSPPTTTFQYSTIQWRGGTEKKVYVVRPDGKVEFFDDRLVPGKVPDLCSPHNYFMNAVMNILAKEGYECAAMTDEQIVMKRPERH